MIRAFCLYGQFGWMFSSGMADLANRLAALSPRIQSSVHGWGDSQAIANALQALPKDAQIVLIGNSLGANSCTQIAAALPTRTIALLVAYDASVLQASGIKPIGGNVTRAICYRSRNYLLPFGHGQLQGPQVETHVVSTIHTSVSTDERLHAITLAATKDLL